MKCPHCGREIPEKALRHHLAVINGRKGGKVRSAAKTRAARLNSRKAGRPKKEKVKCY